MDFQKTRLYLLIALMVVGVALYGAWQREHPEKASAEQKTAIEQKTTDIPQVTQPQTSTIPESLKVLPQATDKVMVKTDVLKAEIDLQGGDFVYTELLDYPQTLKSETGVMLLDQNPARFYVAQSGLIGKNEQGPDSREKGRALYTTPQQQYDLADQDTLRVDLLWQQSGAVKIVKILEFTRGSYDVKVSYHIDNTSSQPWEGSFYGQLQRQYTKEKSNGFMLGVQKYEGGAVYTPDKPYKKLSFSDMKKQSFRQQIEGGWAAMVEHYFLSAYIPNKNSKNSYYTRVDGDNIYNIGAVTPVSVAANTSATVSSQFYLGPEIADNLKALSPGLELTIDYGILWPISKLIFAVLKGIYQFVGNWGWAIIFVTLIIKVVFYKLSASSYRSMAKMRQLQPKVEALKAKYGDNKQQFSVALMELYKEEKMNPLGGCLPILVQIPVFIALYYVLLESVELRQAPFMLWIQDLSARDPYFILPLIMGGTMFLQQKMNPPPPDPTQAKVMMMMPVVFTLLFLSFPSGLVLYWTVNNLLSILQQWYITKTLPANGKKQKGKLTKLARG